MIARFQMMTAEVFDALALLPENRNAPDPPTALVAHPASSAFIPRLPSFQGQVFS
jgi:hypothetical protein